MFNNTGNNYAYVGLDIPISSANINGTGLMLNERVKYTAKTGIAIISTANSNLDGTGTLADLITGGNYGTLVYKIGIKAQGSVTPGMVRIFFKAGASHWLLREVEIPYVTQGARDETLLAVIDDIFYLKSGYLLRVATQNGETFIVTAQGLEMSYP